MSDQDVDLTFVPSEELFQELQRRANAIVLIATFKTDEGQSSEAMSMHWGGGFFAALGLCHEGIAKLQMERRVLTDGEDDK